MLYVLIIRTKEGGFRHTDIEGMVHEALSSLGVGIKYLKHHGSHNIVVAVLDNMDENGDYILRRLRPILMAKGCFDDVSLREVQHIVYGISNVVLIELYIRLYQLLLSISQMNRDTILRWARGRIVVRGDHAHPCSCLLYTSPSPRDRG